MLRIRVKVRVTATVRVNVRIFTVRVGVSVSVNVSVSISIRVAVSVRVRVVVRFRVSVRVGGHGCIGVGDVTPLPAYRAPALHTTQPLTRAKRAGMHTPTERLTEKCFLYFVSILISKRINTYLSIYLSKTLTLTPKQY